MKTITSLIIAISFALLPNTIAEEAAEANGIRKGPKPAIRKKLKNMSDEQREKLKDRIDANGGKVKDGATKGNGEGRTGKGNGDGQIGKKGKGRKAK